MLLNNKKEIFRHFDSDEKKEWKKATILLKFWDQDYPYLEIGSEKKQRLLPIPADSEGQRIIRNQNSVFPLYF
jgi:hypothetical protein